MEVTFQSLMLFEWLWAWRWSTWMFAWLLARCNTSWCFWPVLYHFSISIHLCISNLTVDLMDELHYFFIYPIKSINISGLLVWCKQALYTLYALHRLCTSTCNICSLTASIFLEEYNRSSVAFDFLIILLHNLSLLFQMWWLILQPSCSWFTVSLFNFCNLLVGIFIQIDVILLLCPY